MRNTLSEKTPNNILKQVINSMADSVFFKGLDGKYLGCNLEYENIIGRRETEIIGKTAYDFYDTETADLLTDSDQMVMSNGKRVRYEVWIRKADGTSALIENSKSPLYNDQGDIIGIL